MHYFKVEIQQLSAYKLITDVSLNHGSIFYENVQHLFSDSFISKLTIDSQDFRNLPLSVRNTIANNKNIKQLILDNCDLSIEFLQAVLSSNNVIDHLEIVSLSKTIDNYVEVLDTLFSYSSISYLGIPIYTMIDWDNYDFSKLLFNKNLLTMKLKQFYYSRSNVNFQKFFPALSNVIRSPRLLLKLLHILSYIDMERYEQDSLKGLTEFVSSYEGPTCTITLKLSVLIVIDHKITLPGLVKDVMNLVIAANASFYSVSIELDTALYRGLPRDYQDYAIPVAEDLGCRSGLDRSKDGDTITLYSCNSDS